MKSEKIEKYLHQKVVVYFKDDTIDIGYLYKEEDFPKDPNKLRDGGYVLKGVETPPYYDSHFRKSHIKKIKPFGVYLDWHF